MSKEKENDQPSNNKTNNFQTKQSNATLILHSNYYTADLYVFMGNLKTKKYTKFA